MFFLPGWNSVGDVTRYHRFFEIAGIVCLAALVVTEVLALVYEHRREELAAPRTLSEKQQSELRARLKAAGSFEIAAVRHSTTIESQNFAAMLSSVILSAGWKIDPNPGFRYMADDAQGVVVFVHSGEKPPPGASVLLSELKETGISALGTGSPGIVTGTFELYVGQKLVGP